MQSIESTIKGFRDAAIFPARWPQALDKLAHSLKSDGATLVLKSTTLSSIAVSTSIRPVLPEYMRGPIRDPREQRVNPGLRDGFMPDHAYFSSDEIAREPYYQEFLRPRGFGWNATAALNKDLMVSVKRAFKRGVYDGADLQASNSVLPWLRSVSRTACLAWHSQFDGQLSAFERVNRGAILLDAKARVLQANACVQFGDGFDVAAGVLQTSKAADRDEFRKFLNSLLASGSSFTQPSCATMAVARTSGARPWLFDGIACTDALRSLHSDVAALLLITDLERQAHPRGEVLRQLFGLTPTESALACALTGGETLLDAARRLSISEGHARQRLQSVFQKTRTSRQGELIALLSKLA